MSARERPVGAGRRRRMQGDSEDYGPCRRITAMRWRAAINRAWIVGHHAPGPDKDAAVVDWRDAVLAALDHMEG